MIAQGKTSIIVNTKNSQTLDECLGSIFENTDHEQTPYEIILVNAGKPVECSNAFVKVINYKARSLVDQFNEGYKHVEDFFVAFPDDHVVQPKWLTIAHEGYNMMFPDGLGFLILEDSINHGSIAEIALLRRSFIDKYCGGYYFDPRFKHFCCSPELYKRALHNGAPWALHPGSKVTHNHKMHYDNYLEDLYVWEMCKIERGDPIYEKNMELIVKVMGAEVDRCKKMYYEGNPRVSDDSYDKLKSEYKRLCKEFPKFA